MGQIINGKTQFLDGAGVPLAGGTVTFYIPGTTTPKNTYQDSALTTPNANPLTLDSNGGATIWGTGLYRQIVNDSLGNQVWDTVASAAVQLADITGPVLYAADTGGANAYVVTRSSPATSLTAGMEVIWKASATNTGASTINVDQLGVKSLTNPDGSALAAGVIVAGSIYTCVYDGTKFLSAGPLPSAFMLGLLADADAASARTTLGAIGSSVLTTTGDMIYASAANTPARLGIGNAGQVASVNATATGFSYWAPRGHIAGLTLSNDGVSPNTVIDIAAGECADSTNAMVMKLAAEIAKTTGAWAAGTGNGGLFSGTVAPSTAYHVFVIRKDADGSIDVGIDTSVSASNIPAGYTYFRRIGTMRTDASGNLLRITQHGDLFLYKSTILDYQASTPGTSAILAALSTPPGVRCEAVINFYSTSDTAGDASIYFSSPDVNDEAPSRTAAPLNTANTADDRLANGDIAAGTTRVLTNTSSQIRYRLRGSDSASVVRIATLGYVDTRGRFD